LVLKLQDNVACQNEKKEGAFRWVTERMLLHLLSAVSALKSLLKHETEFLEAFSKNHFARAQNAMSYYEEMM